MGKFRTTVFKRAHHIQAVTGDSFGACLTQAWKLYRLQLQLRKGYVSFSYRKVNGEIRKAEGTLYNLSHLMFSPNTAAKPNYSTLTYFDVEKRAF